MARRKVISSVRRRILLEPKVGVTKGDKEERSKHGPKRTGQKLRSVVDKKCAAKVIYFFVMTAEAGTKQGRKRRKGRKDRRKKGERWSHSQADNYRQIGRLRDWERQTVDLVGQEPSSSRSFKVQFIFEQDRRLSEDLTPSAGIRVRLAERQDQASKSPTMARPWH